MRVGSLPAATLIFLVGVLAMPAYPDGGSHDEGCTNRDLKGAYGFTSKGTILGLEFAELGREEADGKGNLRGIKVGPLKHARIVEAITALMLKINNGYGVKSAGIKITGLP